MRKVQFLSDVKYQTWDIYGDDPIQIAILGVTPNMSKIIEKCARVCYRSEGKLSPDSHKAILRKLSRSGHYSTFEHSNIVIAINNSNQFIADNILEVVSYFPAITVVPVYDYGMYVIRCNARTIVEMYEANMSNEWRGVMPMDNPVYTVILQLRKQLPVEMFDKFVLDPVWEKEEEPDREYINNQPNVEVIHIDNFPWQNSIEKPFAEKLSVATLIVDMNRQISHQFVRHRFSSYSQESQRYVELSDRFEYMPSDDNLNKECFDVDFDDVFPQSCAKKHMSYEEMMIAELAFYKAIRNAGFKPEIARGVLPNDCKTKIAVTRTIEQWRHYFNLRLEQHAQSLHRELAKSMLKAIQENSYWLQDIKEE